MVCTAGAQVLGRGVDSSAGFDACTAGVHVVSGISTVAYFGADSIFGICEMQHCFA
jgi:hypothetical protein